MNPIQWLHDLLHAIEDPTFRAHIYRLLVVAGPLAIAAGVLTQEQATMWLGVASQVLGVGMAVAHTSAKKEQK